MSFGSPYFSLPSFRYERPASLEEALELLSRYGEEAKLMAGGVGLLAFMKERLLDAKYVLDLKGIPELRRLEHEQGRGLTVGATVTLSELQEHPIVKERYGALYDAIRVLSDPTLRNRSTLMGDLCEAIPWVDSPPPLMVLNAEVRVSRAGGGTRSIRAKDFITGAAENALQPDEIATSIFIPEPPSGSRSAYLKFSAGTEFGIASVAGLASGGEVRLAYGCIAATPLEPVEAEEVFRGSGPAGELTGRALKVIGETVEPFTDTLGTAEYRKNIIQVLTVDLFRRLFGG
jgi:CO/xanthine dehydrogenase FAD-binding subunit